MKRKVMLHGPTTLTVSLPAQWVKRNNVHKGDELDVKTTGPILQVYSDVLNQESVFRADISSLSPDMTKRLLGSLHKRGYDVLELQCMPQQIQHIQKRINTMLMGYEIVNIKDNCCIIKTVSRSTEESFEPLFRRLFLVTIDFAENVAAALEKQQLSKLEDLLSLEETNNKLTNYVHRLINQQFSTKEHLSYLYLIAWILENIADEYKEICLLYSGQKKIDKEFVSLCWEAHTLLQALYDVFYSFSFEKIEALLSQTAQMKKKITGLLDKKQQGGEVQFLFAINNAVRSIEHTVGSIIAHHN